MLPSHDDLSNSEPQGPVEPRRILIGSPPPTAVGGIATHTRVLLSALPGAELFDQWWPLRERSASRFVRLAAHVLALARLRWALRGGERRLLHLQVSERGVARDLVHARIARRRGALVVAHLHSEFASTADMRTLKRLLRLADAVIVLDEDTKSRVSQMIGGDATPIYVVPNPVDPIYLSHPLPRREEVDAPLRLFCPALVGELKNQRGILAAIDLHVQDGGEADLVMAGLWDPEMTVADRQAIEGHPRAHHLGLLSPEQLVRQLDEADALVLFSRTEGEPMVVLEAMARGLPVIASDVGAISSMTPESPLNIVVPVGNVELLAAAFDELAQVPRRDRRVSISRDLVAQVRSPVAHVRALDAIYASIT